MTRRRAEIGEFDPPDGDRLARDHLDAGLATQIVDRALELRPIRRNRSKSPETASCRLTAERPQARRRARHFLAEIKEGAARKNRIVHDPNDVDGWAAARRRLNSEGALAVARQGERQQAVAERERRVGVGLGAHARTGQDENRQRQAQAEGEEAIAEQQADDGRHARAVRGGAPVPRPCPIPPRAECRRE